MRNQPLRHSRKILYNAANAKQPYVKSYSSYKASRENMTLDENSLVQRQIVHREKYCCSSIGKMPISVQQVWIKDEVENWSMKTSDNHNTIL